jgi:hypothetical protein
LRVPWRNDVIMALLLTSLLFMLNPDCVEELIELSKFQLMSSLKILLLFIKISVHNARLSGRRLDESGLGYRVFKTPKPTN